MYPICIGASGLWITVCISLIDRAERLDEQRMECYIRKSFAVGSRKPKSDALRINIVGNIFEFVRKTCTRVVKQQKQTS